MTREYDVLVIGGGLAGRMAGLAAAKVTTNVGLVQRAESPLRSSTGLIDVLGYRQDGTGPVSNPYAAMQDLPADHPYTALGPSVVRDGLATFDSVVGDQYAGGHTKTNALVPTQLGTPKPADRYPRSTRPGLLSREDETLLLGFRGLPGLDGEFAAGTLRKSDLPYEVRGSSIDLLEDATVENPRLRLASALDANERWPDPDVPVREVLAESIRDQYHGEARIGVPAILGRTRTAEIRKALEDTIEADIFEYPTDPPSMLGIRLADRLEAALRDRGVDIRNGHGVSTFRETDGKVSEVVIEDSGLAVSASQFVLATGGLIGGGLVETEGAIRETVFDLPVQGPGKPTSWADTNPFAGQPFARGGLNTDTLLRPVDPVETDGTSANDRKPLFANLRACGSVLGGYDSAIEHSRAGVEIATGVKAGRVAGREVQS